MKKPWHIALFLIVFIAVLATSSKAITVALIGLMLWTLLGAPQTLQAMALTVVLKYLHPVLFSYGVESGPLFWLVLFVAMLRILPMMTAPEFTLLWPVWLFGATVAVLASIVSAAPVVSLLKIFTFVGVVSTVVVAAGRLTALQLQSTTRWLLTLGAVVIGLSACTLISPEIAFKRVPNSIQGIFSHPQTLGTFIVPFATFWAASMLLMRDAQRRFEIFLLLAAWAIMFMTLARTATIACVAGVIAAAGIRVLRGRPTATQLGLGRIAAITAGVAAVFVVAALTTDVVAQSIHAFIHKREAQDLGTAFYESRGMGIQSQWDNFLQRPLTGWGFGVYADGKFPDGVVEVAGIPISVPVEKGFVPTAILEETGIIGSALFFFAIWRLGRATFHTSDLRWIAVFVACLMVNIGEAVILSPGGVGLILWLFIALSLRHATLDTSLSTVAVAAPMPLRKYNNLMGIGPSYPSQ